MSGAIHFPMGDIYPAYGYGTTEKTIPDADDQNALTDDLKATETANTKGAKKKNIFLAIIIVLCAVILLGGRR